MIDLSRQYLRLKDEIDQAVLGVIERANYINGPEVGLFASDLQNYLGVNHVIPCGNGTDALQLALMSLELKPGDEVITSAFSFIASAEAILLLGLKPVFVDVDENTFNIDCNRLESAITSKTAVLLPVHLFGQGADMLAINHLAEKHGLHIIEDVAQSMGASFDINGESKKLGTIGTIGCTSFFPSKNLGCYGDGGACYTDNQELAKRIGMLGKHGSIVRYHHEIVGVNSRLDTLHAAVLRVKLKYMDNLIAKRQKLAEQYNTAFENIQDIAIPKKEANSTHTYNQYTIRVKNGRRNDLQAFLKEKGIPSQVYYPAPLHQQNVFKKMSDNKFDCPVSERLCSEVLSLPVSTEMEQEKINYIIENVQSFFE